MFNLQRYKTKLQAFIFSPSPVCFPLFELFRSPISLQFSSTVSDSDSFTVSHLVNNWGFSTETALKASKRVRFQVSEKPDSFLNFLRSHGFSNSRIHSIVSRVPRLLLCDPDKKVVPKFEFLLSKGLSASDIVLMVTECPYILDRSLQNHIIPLYGTLDGLFHSREKTNKCIKRYPDLLIGSRVHNNVEMLRDIGVADSNVARLLVIRSALLCSSNLGKAVDEVKQLGFDPSDSRFASALAAKLSLGKSYWDVKVNAYKKWGWSEEMVMEAFRRQPLCMLHTTDKINAVMSYWVNELGWDSLTLVRWPTIIGYSLQRRVVPRASVLQFLLSKGLISKNASLLTPFFPNEKLFLQRFVECFGEETPQLLKLYEEKMNLMDEGEKSGK